MNEVVKTSSIILGTLTASLFLSSFAFSSRSRDVIKERAKWRSEISGRSDMPCECLHFNHNKKNSFYNNPANGVYATAIEHLAHHILYRNRPDGIGLNKYENNWAIDTLWKRVLSYYELKNLTEDDMVAELEKQLEVVKQFIRSREG